MQMNPRLKYLGISMFITTLIIPAFYFVVGGWIFYYLFTSFSMPAENFGTVFSSMSARPFLSYSLSILFLVVCAFFNYKGVNEGIEKCNKILMPMLCVIMLILAVFSLKLPGAREGLEFMFRPDFSKISEKMLIDALGQSFFTLSVGAGALLVYGSYMTEEQDILKNSYCIIAFDTLVAICAGIIIFPAVFTYNVEPQGGPGLVFVVLPEIFRQMPCGFLVSLAFFLLLMFAAITSGISFVESPIAVLIEMYNMSRKKATVVIGSVIAILLLPSALSAGVLSNVRLFGKTFFDIFDFIASNLLMPLNAMFICLGMAIFLRQKNIIQFQNRYMEGYSGLWQNTSYQWRWQQ